MKKPMISTPNRDQMVDWVYKGIWAMYDLVLITENAYYLLVRIPTEEEMTEYSDDRFTHIKNWIYYNIEKGTKIFTSSEFNALSKETRHEPIDL